jgi:hypothetical protein
MSRSPAAVIVGADLNGLGVVRNLAGLNMPIFVVGKSRFESAKLSRFARPMVTPRLEGADLVSTLMELSAEAGDDAVLFSTDGCISSGALTLTPSDQRCASCSAPATPPGGRASRKGPCRKAADVPAWDDCACRLRQAYEDVVARHGLR